jgi:hypothetical protein
MILIKSALLATALPLGLLLIILISISIYLSCSLIRHQRNHKLESLAAKRQLQAHQQKIESFSKMFDESKDNAGVYDSGLKDSFEQSYWSPQAPLRTYLGKWIEYDGSQVSIALETSRLEKILFPKSLVDASGAGDTDFDAFPNPQHYTSLEIAELLKS